MTCVVLLAFLIQQTRKGGRFGLASTAITVAIFYTSRIIYRHYGLMRVIIHGMLLVGLALGLSLFLEHRKQHLQTKQRMVQ